MNIENSSSIIDFSFKGINFDKKTSNEPVNIYQNNNKKNACFCEMERKASPTYQKTDESDENLDYIEELSRKYKKLKEEEQNESKSKILSLSNLRNIKISNEQKLEKDYGIKIDKTIDEHYMGSHNDCYLVSTIEALSNTKEGRELIKDNITINKDSVSVYFPGIDYTSEISNSELKNAKEDGSYAGGDDDVMLMELAIQDVYTKIRNGKISAPEEIQDSINDNKDVLYAGYMQDVAYLYTGKLGYQTVNPLYGDTYDKKFEDRHDSDVEGVLNYKKDNTDNVVMTLSMKVDNGFHAYCVKEVDDENVIIVDPRTCEEFSYTRDELKEVLVDIEHCEI